MTKRSDDMGQVCARRARPEIPDRAEIRLIRRIPRRTVRWAIVKVLTLRLRWLQSRVRSSLNTTAVSVDNIKRQRQGVNLANMTFLIWGSKSMFSHLKRMTGTLYFVEFLSDKGNVTKETRKKEELYRQLLRSGRPIRG